MKKINQLYPIESNPMFYYSKSLHKLFHVGVEDMYGVPRPRLVCSDVSRVEFYETGVLVYKFLEGKKSEFNNFFENSGEAIFDDLSFAPTKASDINYNSDFKYFNIDIVPIVTNVGLVYALDFNCQNSLYVMDITTYKKKKIKELDEYNITKKLLDYEFDFDKKYKIVSMQDLLENRDNLNTSFGRGTSYVVDPDDVEEDLSDEENDDADGKVIVSEENANLYYEYFSNDKDK